jgi:hypothetical protein
MMLPPGCEPSPGRRSFRLRSFAPPPRISSHTTNSSAGVMESYRNLGVLIANRFVHSSPSDSQTYVFRHIGYISPRVSAREHGWVHATFLTAVDPLVCSHLHQIMTPRSPGSRNYEGMCSIESPVLEEPISDLTNVWWPQPRCDIPQLSRVLFTAW